MAPEASYSVTTTVQLLGLFAALALPVRTRQATSAGSRSLSRVWGSPTSHTSAFVLRSRALKLQGSVALSGGTRVAASPSVDTIHPQYGFVLQDNGPGRFEIGSPSRRRRWKASFMATAPTARGSARSRGRGAVDRVIVARAERPIAVAVRPVPPLGGVVDESGSRQ
jgi:hypothetical protein